MTKIDLTPLDLAGIDTVIAEGYNARRKYYEELKQAASSENVQETFITVDTIRHLENSIRDVDIAIQQFNNAVKFTLQSIRSSLKERANLGEVSKNG